MSPRLSKLSSAKSVGPPEFGVPPRPEFATGLPGLLAIISPDSSDDNDKDDDSESWDFPDFFVAASSLDDDIEDDESLQSAGRTASSRRRCLPFLSDDIGRLTVGASETS